MDEESDIIYNDDMDDGSTQGFRSVIEGISQGGLDGSLSVNSPNGDDPDVILSLRVEMVRNLLDELANNTSRGNLNEILGENWVSDVNNWMINPVATGVPQLSNISNVNFTHPESQRTTPNNQ